MPYGQRVNPPGSNGCLRHTLMANSIVLKPCAPRGERLSRATGQSRGKEWIDPQARGMGRHGDDRYISLISKEIRMIGGRMGRGTCCFLDAAIVTITPLRTPARQICLLLPKTVLPSGKLMIAGDMYSPMTVSTTSRRASPSKRAAECLPRRLDEANADTRYV